MVSGVAPAPNGTTMRTVLVGQSCANAGVAAKRSTNANAMRLNSDTPGVSVFSSPCGICPARLAEVKGSMVSTDGRRNGHGPRDHDPRACRVHRRPRVRHAPRPARGADRALWRRIVQRPVLTHLH